MGTVSEVGYGSVATGGNTCVTDFPTGYATGDILVCAVASVTSTSGPEPDMPTTYGTWTAFPTQEGGSAAAGNNSGARTCRWFYLVADGDEPGCDGNSAGTITVAWDGTVSNAALTCRIGAYTSDTSGEAWEVAEASGADTTQDTTWSVTFDADPGLEDTGVALIQAAWAPRAGTPSGFNRTWSGLTSGALSLIGSTSNANGWDVRQVVWDLFPGSGTSTTAAPTISCTTSITTDGGAGSIITLHSVASTPVRTGSLTGTGAFTATSTEVEVRTGALSGTGTFTAVARVVESRTGSLTGTGAFTATSTEVEVRTGALSGTGTFTADRTVVVVRTGDLAGTGTFTATHTVESAVSRTGSLTGTGEFTATAVAVHVVTGDLAGSGTFAATGAPVLSAAAPWGGAGAFTATSLTVYTLTGDLTGAGTVTATVSSVHTSTAQLEANGVFTATAQVVGGVPTVTAPLTGTGEFTATAVVVLTRTAALAGTGALSATSGVLYAASAALGATGQFTATVHTVAITAAPLAGAGAFTAERTVVVVRTAPLTATGVFTAVLGSLVHLVLEEAGPPPESLGGVASPTWTGEAVEPVLTGGVPTRWTSLTPHNWTGGAP